jgi:hypothetical protein
VDATIVKSHDPQKETTRRTASTTSSKAFRYRHEQRREGLPGRQRRHRRRQTHKGKRQKLHLSYFGIAETTMNTTIGLNPCDLKRLRGYLNAEENVIKGFLIDERREAAKRTSSTTSTTCRTPA